LDDNPFTYQNNIENAIPIKPYFYFPLKPDNDIELLRVIFLMNIYLYDFNHRFHFHNYYSHIHHQNRHH